MEPTQQKNIFGLSRNIFFLGLTSLFNDFSSEMVFAVFPAFVTSVLHSGARSLGLVDGVAEASANFFKIYSGTISDRLQKRKVLVVSGYLISVITRPIYLLVSGVGGVLGLRFLDRVGKGLRDAPRDAIISLSTPKETLGRSFGYHRTMDTIGAILGPLAAYIILLNFPLRFDIVFVTAFFVGALALLTLVFIKDISVAIVNPSMIRNSFAELSPQFRRYAFAMFILSIGSLPIAVLLLKTTSIGLVIADIPLFYMVYNVVYAIFSTPAGILSDRVGARTVLFIGYTALLIGYTVLAFANSTAMLFFGFLLLGLFPALTDGVQRSLASQLTAQNVRGGGIGWLTGATGIGALFAGVLGGYLWQVYSPATAVMISTFFVILGLVMLFTPTPPQPSPQAE